jgi:uncharacterized protein YdeI (YjbR/CyaY-like superfamily)
MGKKDARVDAYIAKAAPFAKPILNRFRKAVHAGCPDVTETLKWSVPHFDHKGVLGGMAAFKAHCRVGFWKHALLTSAPKNKRSGPMASVATLADMPDERTLAKMAKEAATLNEAGVKVKRAVKAPKPAPKAPPYLLAALKANRKAHAAWQAFSPSAQREYVEWMTGAKSEATRDRRLETAVGWIAEGKGRNWKYQTAPRRAAGK